MIGGKSGSRVGGTLGFTPGLFRGFVCPKPGVGTNGTIVGIKSRVFGDGSKGFSPSGTGIGYGTGFGFTMGSSRFPSGGAEGG